MPAPETEARPFSLPSGTYLLRTLASVNSVPIVVARRFPPPPSTIVARLSRSPCPSLRVVGAASPSRRPSQPSRAALPTIGIVACCTGTPRSSQTTPTPAQTQRHSETVISPSTRSLLLCDNKAPGLSRQRCATTTPARLSSLLCCAFLIRSLAPQPQPQPPSSHPSRPAAGHGSDTPPSLRSSFSFHSSTPPLRPLTGPRQLR